jgi:UDP-N-acetylglucosamine--N-acetylmuramyl-(pentapeptide) pyrophosphoryl-undecaprenol N-acetylglucosamine transferase
VEEETLRILIAGGGTGGHVFPALAVADELRRRHPHARIVFVGGRRGVENRLVPSAGYPLRTLALAGMKGVGVRARVTAAAAAAWAVLRCLGWMIGKRPDLVIGVGGYASGPAVLAAWILGVKTMVQEQNHYPGATNRLLARRVDAACVPSEAARDRLGGVGIITGNPVRPEFARIGDPPGADALSLLVFGGSRGARSINEAVIGALPGLREVDPPPRVVHQTGKEDETRVAAAYREHLPEATEVRSFLDDMPERLAAADLAICRAGASTLAELAAAGRPAILVPFPFATDDHQRLNAEAVQEAGAARIVLDKDLTGEGIAELVRSMNADRDRLREMGRAARNLARPDAAERIADVADDLLAGRGTGRRVSDRRGGDDVS